MSIEVKKVTISVVEHSKTGLLAAFSDDLPGLLVNARSETDLTEQIPLAIRELLEAQGKQVIHVTSGRPMTVEGFHLKRINALAELRAA